MTHTSKWLEGYYSMTLFCLVLEEPREREKLVHEGGLILFCVFLVVKECYPVFFHKLQGDFEVEMYFVYFCEVEMYFVYFCLQVKKTRLIYVKKLPCQSIRGSSV